jgi:hypothetical protein
MRSCRKRQRDGIVSVRVAVTATMVGKLVRLNRLGDLEADAKKIGEAIAAVIERDIEI